MDNDNPLAYDIDAAIELSKREYERNHPEAAAAAAAAAQPLLTTPSTQGPTGPRRGATNNWSPQQQQQQFQRQNATAATPVDPLRLLPPILQQQQQQQPAAKTKSWNDAVRAYVKANKPPVLDLSNTDNCEGSGISTYMRNKDLKTLNLSGTDFSNGGCKDFWDTLSRSMSITTLDLSNTKLPASASKNIGNILRTTVVTELNIANNPDLGDATAKEILGALSKNPQIQDVDYTCCNFSEEIADQILNTLNNNRVHAKKDKLLQRKLRATPVQPLAPLQQQIPPTPPQHDAKLDAQDASFKSNAEPPPGARAILPADVQQQFANKLENRQLPAQQEPLAAAQIAPQQQLQQLDQPNTNQQQPQQPPEQPAAQQKQQEQPHGVQLVLKHGPGIPAKSGLSAWTPDIVAGYISELRKSLHAPLLQYAQVNNDPNENDDPNAAAYLCSCSIQSNEIDGNLFMQLEPADYTAMNGFTEYFGSIICDIVYYLASQP